MSLKEELKALEEKKTLCKIGALIQTLDEETTATLNRVLNSSASSRSITNALRESGYMVSKTTLATHRNKQCCCEVTNEPV